jgi:hypothetical protein
MEINEGDKCECGGVFEFIRQRPCSCHICPPCNSCTDAPLMCNKCGIIAEELEESI